MKKWAIVADSSCDFINNIKNENIGFLKVPFIISVDGVNYVDDESLDVENMLTAMENSPNPSPTSCPNPSAWYDAFKQSDNIIAVTISSNLSGSYNSAITARDMILEEYPDKKIYIVDSKSAGSALSMIVQKTLEFIEKGFDFEGVKKNIQDYAERLHTVFALCSFDNLVKNGRLNKFAGIISGKLGIWGVGVASPEGTIVVKNKTLGNNRAITHILEDMKQNGFAGGNVVISHCQNFELANRLKEEILAIKESAKVKILSTGGLCSFYAERKGLIIGYE